MAHSRMTPTILRAANKHRSATLLHYMQQHEITRREVQALTGFSRGWIDSWFQVHRHARYAQPTHATLRQLGAVRSLRE